MLEASYGHSRLPKAMNFQSRRWPQKAKSKYSAPALDDTRAISLDDALAAGKRPALADNQLDLLRGASKARSVSLYVSGDTSLFSFPSVSIVGTREVSEEGAARARRLAKELSQAGIVVVSGLAKGVDTAAHTSVIANGGRTIAVIGTPLSKAYPAENAALQEQIYTAHLLVSPFAEGETVFKSNFPKRNRVMAAISDATVIIEASDTSGTLHQAAECQRLGRWLFITKVVAEDPNLEWPKRFIGKPMVGVLRETSDIVAAISG